MPPITPKIQYACRLAVAVILCFACMSGLVSCAAWDWLWTRETDRPPVESDLLEKADAYPEGDYEFEPNMVHEGSDGIHYGGTKGSENRKYCVIIDPGHQEKANMETELVGPGALDVEANRKIKITLGSVGAFTGQLEHELNLSVALKLRNELCERGYSVVMIREVAHVNISNAERAEIANRYGKLYDGAILIRIHANGDENDETRGALTICQTAQNPYVNLYSESRELSEKVLEAFCAETNFRKYSIPVWENDDMTGINWSRIPTTIIEMGFLSNETEDYRMSYDDFRENAAIGIANGIDAFFSGTDVVVTAADQAEE